MAWVLESESRGRFRLREDATKLHCHCSPLEADLELSPAGEGATELAIDGRVPGWGLLAGKHAREQTQLLARRVGLAAIASQKRSEARA